VWLFQFLCPRLEFPMSDEQSALSLLAGFNTAYAEANANNGEGGLGEWPPSGKHACTVLDIILTPMTGAKAQKFKDKKDGNREHIFDGVNVHLLYRCNDVIPTQKDPSKPLEWKGSSMFIPSNPSAIPAGLSWVKEIAASRLKGHLSVINGQTSTNIMADLQSAMARVKSSPVSVLVRCDERISPQTAEQKASGKSPYVNKEEFLLELLAN